MSPLRKAVLFFGCCLILSGLILTGFIGYKYYFNNEQIAAETTAISEQFSENLNKKAVPLVKYDPLNPPVMTSVEPYQQFANIYIPKFGADYVRPVAEGTERRQVLDKGFVGHYAGTVFPGGIGNFSVAAHRATEGAGFRDLEILVPGDKVYIQTADGYYTYSIESTEVVLPSEVRVIYPVPNQEGVTPTERYITLTTCTPITTSSHRAVAHGKFVEWRPLAAGAPKEIAPYVQ